MRDINNFFCILAQKTKSKKQSKKTEKQLQDIF